MNIGWKKYSVDFNNLYTNDGKCFRYVTLEFEQKLNLSWLRNNNDHLHNIIISIVREIFCRVQFIDLYEGKDPTRMINENKLFQINAKINMQWMQFNDKHHLADIRNCQIKYLIK